jgi:hypothetical protein
VEEVVVDVVVAAAAQDVDDTLQHPLHVLLLPHLRGSHMIMITRLSLIGFLTLVKEVVYSWTPLDTVGNSCTSRSEDWPPFKQSLAHSSCGVSYH